MYEENYNNARHNETQRSTVTNFIILIAGGIGTLASSGGFTSQDLLSLFPQRQKTDSEQEGVRSRWQYLGINYSTRLS